MIAAMWWRIWVVAWFGLACSTNAASTTQACLHTAAIKHPLAAPLCELAWRSTGDVHAAIAGAHVALCSYADAALERWAERVPLTAESAQIYQYLSESLRTRGELKRAESTLDALLAIYRDQKPANAANVALHLLALRLYRDPPEASIHLAKHAWDLASASGNDVYRTFANAAMIDLLIDLGELRSAEAVFKQLDPKTSSALYNLASGRLAAAKGRSATAVSFFKKMGRDPQDAGADSDPMFASTELTWALLDLGKVGDARAVIEEAYRSKDTSVGSVGSEARLLAADAAVALAEGHFDHALARVDEGLASPVRDAARVLLLNVRGDVLARRGDVDGAEAAWHDAANAVEDWRASIPINQLRSGVIATHRHALEAWLESVATRRNLDGVLEVTRRILGRSLLDRMRQRETNSPIAADESIRRVVQRLSDVREAGATLTNMRDLHDAPHDFVAIVSGSRSIWAVRRRNGQLSVEQLGERKAIRDLVDVFLRNPEDQVIAGKLGERLFPVGTLPADDAILAVLLDQDVADLPLAGLRTGGHYLVERVALMEVFAPDQLFAAPSAHASVGGVAIGDPDGDLEAAAREVRAVAGALSIRPLVGVEATRAAVPEGAHLRVLHIATHSTIKDDLAGLVFHGETLTSHDILVRKIAPRLAVLASCRSQTNDQPMTSLVASFLAAGVSGVIGVKRSLDDGDGETLMLDFYGAGGPDDPARALARAQRKAIASGRRPLAWSTVSFFGGGEWLETSKGAIDNGGSQR